MTEIEHEETRREQRLDAARDRMTGTAVALAHVLGPADAASVMLAAGVTLLERALGPDHAGQYLHLLAEGVADGEAGPPAGHA